MGNYDPSHSNRPEYNSEQGDFVRLILTHDAILSKPKEKTVSHLKAITYENDHFNLVVIESDGFKLPTLFGENEDFTNLGYDSNDFRNSDLFDENDEVYADTQWSSADPEDILVRVKFNRLVSVFDVYTVTFVTSPFQPLTEMSAPPTHPVVQGQRQPSPFLKSATPV